MRDKMAPGPLANLLTYRFETIGPSTELPYGRGSVNDRLLPNRDGERPLGAGGLEVNQFAGFQIHSNEIVRGLGRGSVRGRVVFDTELLRIH